MGSGEEGEEAEGLAAVDGGGGGGGGVGGGVVGEGVDEHRDAVEGKGFDDLFEVVGGDLMSVAVGELGERDEDAGLELDHGEMGGEGGRGGGFGGGGGFGELG